MKFTFQSHSQTACFTTVEIGRRLLHSFLGQDDEPVILVPIAFTSKPEAQAECCETFSFYSAALAHNSLLANRSPRQSVLTYYKLDAGT